MFCGTADGLLLPPNPVYKAKNLWGTRFNTWCNGGLKGSQLIKIKVL